MKGKLANAKKLSDVKSSDYDGVFYVGGHGPVLDLASDEVNATLASEVRISQSCLYQREKSYGDFLVLPRWKDHLCCLPWPRVSSDPSALCNLRIVLTTLTISTAP